MPPSGNHLTQGVTVESLSDLTYHARMRRFREVARIALEAYGLDDAQITFISYHGNVIYRVDMPKEAPPTPIDRRYTANRYVLRVHMDYHSTEAIRSELQWLAALRHDAGRPLSELC